MEKRDTAYMEGRMFIFYTVQKDSGILYKRWDAINLDMRMNTRGGKESKDREGGENGEKAGESRQMLLSRRETSLIRCKKFICVGEKKYIEAGGVDVGAMEVLDVHRNTPESHASRHDKANPQCRRIVMWSTQNNQPIGG